MDELIDRALKSYTAREPGASLETRILARAREQRRSRAGWLVAAAMIAAAGLCLFLLPHRRTPHLAVRALPPMHIAEAPPYAAAQAIPPALAPRHRRHRTPEPKLAVFPSPAPIPDSEIALAHALSGNPELAASLLAKPAPIAPTPITIEPLSIKALDED